MIETIEVVEPIVDTIENRPVIETIEVEPIVDTLEVGTVVETIEDEPVIETKVEVGIPESRELHTPKRSHLPFNVMMLKQDKLKWEENKRRRSMPTEVPPEKVIEETIVVQEESNDIEESKLRKHR